MEMPLQAELLHCHVAYEESKAEQEASKTFRIDPVPPALAAQLTAYKDWRLSPLNFQRSGAAVVDVTAENDCSTMLRFLGYAVQEHAFDPSLAIFGSARLAVVAQAWLKAMLDRSLLYSTMSNYVNSLCNIAAYWWDGGGEVEDAAYELTPQPPDALLRLRAQCESQAKQHQLYAKKPANWLDWDKVSDTLPTARSTPLIHAPACRHKRRVSSAQRRGQRLVVASRSMRASRC